MGWLSRLLCLIGCHDWRDLPSAAELTIKSEIGPVIRCRRCPHVSLFRCD